MSKILLRSTLCKDAGVLVAAVRVSWSDPGWSSMDSPGDILSVVTLVEILRPTPWLLTKAPMAS